jgi:DNA-binding transcriptional LysR family regulator
MEFRHFRYFITVAEEQNFSRAAERLNIAQPPLSQQIRNLEDELGFQLFDRSQRQLQLTQAGQWFLERAYRIFNQLETAKEEARKISRGETGQLVVGYVNFAFLTLAIEIIKVFRSNFPEVKLVLRELLTAEQFKALPVSEIDLGIAFMPVKDEGLAFEVISHDKFVAVLPESHRMAGQPYVHLEELADDQFIMMPRQTKSVFSDKVLGMCHQAGFVPKVSQEIIQMSSGLSMVAAGVGVGIMPSHVQNSGTRGVVFKPFYAGAAVIDLAVVWRKSDTSPVLKGFLNVVKEVKNLHNFSTLPDSPLPV